MARASGKVAVLAPCSTRPSSRSAKLPATAARTLPATKIAKVRIKIFRWPYRSPKRPEDGCGHGAAEEVAGEDPARHRRIDPEFPHERGQCRNQEGLHHRKGKNRHRQGKHQKPPAGRCGRAPSDCRVVVSGGAAVIVARFLGSWIDRNGIFHSDRSVRESAVPWRRDSHQLRKPSAARPRPRGASNDGSILQAAREVFYEYGWGRPCPT